MTEGLTTEALELLGRLTGSSTAAFRPGQLEAIVALVEQRARVLVVQRTGWGKSAVYFVATRLLRDRGAGPTVLVSPLLALMRNQIQMAQRAGVRAATINSENRDDWEDTERRVAAGEIDILLISPERLNNERFRRDVLPALVGSVGLLVVDEAHCISDWGHDFRPDYRRISRVLGLLPPRVPVLCTTATANDRVVADIVEQLGNELTVIRGPLDRESLALSVVPVAQPAERLAWLATVIPTLPGSGIVYCLTVADTDRVAKWLSRQGIGAVAYSGDTESDSRLHVEDALLRNDVKVVVATSALGMGYDKPDLGFVVHYQSPGSPIAYYQQVGRAGRSLSTAHGVLLSGTEDADIQDYFIRTAFPPREHAETIVGLLGDRAEPVSTTELERHVNARRTRMDSMLKVLEVEGAVEKVRGGWLRTLKPWTYDQERVDQVTALRRAEQQAMRDYAAATGCRMQFLRGALDDPEASPCGRCDNCAGLSPWPVELDPALVAQAVEHLRSARLDIDPRRQWPSGLGDGYPKGSIAPDRRLSPGRALSVSGDGGWGSVVKRAKYQGRQYRDELVMAATKLLARWQPEPAPAWITWVPSTTSPDQLADFVRRLGIATGLPTVEVLARVRARQPQKLMENSAQQLRNVYGAFDVVGEVPSGPVLLVDDTVDSRWTLTVTGAALREAGAGPVYPFALALAMSD